MARLIAENELSTVLPNLAEPRIVTQGSLGTPISLLNLIDSCYEKYRLALVNASPNVPKRPGVRHETIFIGASLRKYPEIDYYPARLSLATQLYWGALIPDIVLIQVSRPIKGKVSLGIEVQVIPGALEAAKAHNALVIAQINPKMPFTYGDSIIDLDDIDLAIEIEDDLPVAMPIKIDEVSAEVGKHLADRVPNGATLQLGIGAVTNAALASLEKHQGLRVWTELMTDPFKHLLDVGAMDDSEPITATFLYGSEELYNWADNNPRLRLLRCETTNDPGIIAQQRNMISVNTALQIDLFGQANASRVNNRIISGTGGQTDFIVGAMHSPGGEAILALKSWHEKANCSTIIPKITEPITSLQPSCVLSENGQAQIFGATQRNQALGLIENVAHENAKEALISEAEAMGLLD